EQRDAEIAAQIQRLTVRADLHVGVIDLAVARIEDVAVLVFELALALHVADEGEAEERLVLAIVLAFAANNVLLARLPKHLGESALEGPVVLDDQHPDDGLAVLDLLPQAGGRWFRRRRAGRETERRRAADDRREKIRSGNPHDVHR